MPRLGQTDKFKATFVGNVRGFLGVAPCGDADAWRYGVSFYENPAPCNCVREAVIPVQEIPVGDVDGVNQVFVTSQIPMSAESLVLFVNGVEQSQNVNYSISGDTIYFTSSSTPTEDSNVVVYYWVIN